jgi:hypothetical protein
LRQAIGDADHGVLTGPATLTVGRYLESWLGDIEGTVRRHTYEQYKSVIGKHLVPEIGGRNSNNSLVRLSASYTGRRSKLASLAAQSSTSTLPCTKRSRTPQKTGLSAPTPRKA